MRTAPITIAALLAVSRAGAAATYIVTDTSDSGVGSLRSAIIAANADPGSIIQFQMGMTGTIALTTALPPITQSLSIQGPGANAMTVSGAGAYGIFVVDAPSASVTIAGLTLADGRGIAAAGTSYGGAIEDAAGALTVSGCAFSGNQAAYGGAIYTEASLTVSGSTFSQNSASSEGGAVFAGAASSATQASLNNSTFYENSASEGGAIFIADQGAASALTANNDTFYGNTAATGGGIDNSGGTLSVNNSIFAAETAEDCAGNGCPVNQIGGNLAGAAVSLLPLGYYGGSTETMLPLPGSAAICAGSATAASSAGLTTDQRGWLMSASTCSSGLVDAGAVQSEYLTVTTLADQSDATPDCSSGTGNSCSLRDAIDLGNAATASNDGGADVQFLSSLASVSAPGTITLVSYLPVRGAVNIAGPGQGALTISGANTTSIFGLNAGDEAAVYGVTIANGNSTAEGGGIYNAGTFSLLNSTLTKSISSSTGSTQGGGIYSSGMLTIANSTISANAASNSEYAGQGGGIYNVGVAVVTGSTISGNSSSGISGTAGGGGIYNAGTLYLARSTIAGNSAVGTGTASAFGGGMLNYGTVTAFDVTVSGNSVSAPAAALAYGGGTAGTGGLTLANSIVAGNEAEGTQAALADIWGNYTGASGAGNVASNDASATSTIAIGLSPLQYNGIGANVETMIPLPGSPAICAGLQSEIPAGTATDERGYPNTNISYSGYSSATPCVDAGAVQTNYTAVEFVQQPTNTAVNAVIAPAPSVTVLETDTNLSAGNTDAVSGVPVTLTLDGNGVLGGTLTQASANGVADFSDLTVSAAGLGDMLVTDPITVVSTTQGTTTIPALDSNPFNVGMSAPKISFAPAPASQVYGKSIAAGSLDATATEYGSPIAGTFAYTATVNGNIETLVAGSTILPAGNYTVTAEFTPSNSSLYEATSASANYTVTSGTLTVTAANAARVYGTANPAFTGSVTGAVNGDSFTETFSTAATVASNPGSYAIVPAVTGTDLSDYTVVDQDGTLTISKAGSTTALALSSTSVNPGQSVTLSATVASATSGTPTGTVSFYDGSTLLDTATLSNGAASYSAAGLAAGTTTSLTAVYSGDVDFNPSSSAPSGVTVGPLAFTLAVGGSSTQSVSAGGTASYSLAVAPTYGVYPGAVSFSVSGLPAGATATFSPSTVASDAGAQTVTLTVQMAGNASAANRDLTVGRRLASTALSLLLLPLAASFRRARFRLHRTLGVLLLIVAAIAGTSALSGCGVIIKGQQSYNATVTATSGSMVQTAGITLDVAVN